jgi:hypothetical protein
VILFIVSAPARRIALPTARAGERDLRDVGMAGDLGAGHLTPAGDDVEHTGRQFARMQRFGYHLRLDRTHLARLDDCRATGRDCGRELAANEAGIAVPRRDEAGDTQGLHHHLGRADATRKAIILQNPGHIEQDICRVVSHEAGARDGCAILFDNCFQQVLPTRLDGGVHPPQQCDAFGLARA